MNFFLRGRNFNARSVATLLVFALSLRTKRDQRYKRPAKEKNNQR